MIAMLGNIGLVVLGLSVVAGAWILMTFPGLGGQQPPPQNASPAGQLVPGITPGVSGQVVASRVIIIGSGGELLVYSPVAGPGNLIASIAGTAGTDPFGNPVPQGLNVTVGAISGTAFSGGTISGTTISGGTITGAAIVDTGGGYFAYNGSPAAGNLFYSSTDVASTDAHGNAYLAGVTFYGNPASGVWIAVNLNTVSSAFGLQYYSATSYAGPWGIDAFLRRTASNQSQLEIGPIVEVIAAALIPSTPTAGSALYANTGGTNPNCLRLMKPDGSSYGIGETINMITGSETINNAFPVQISTGGISLSWAVESGFMYYFEAMLRWTTTATGDSSMGFTAPSLSQCDWLWQGDWSLTINGSGSFASPVTLTGAAADTFTLKAWGTFTPSANGTFACAAGTGSAGSFTVNAASFLKIRTTV